VSLNIAHDKVTVYSMQLHVIKLHRVHSHLVMSDIQTHNGINHPEKLSSTF
jgi:hypothetical protein